MQWCKNRTQGYRGVEVTNFTKSWEDGLAYCALLHSYRPDLIPFDSLSPGSGQRDKNLTIAFKAAAQLGIPELLDQEDFGLEKLSMMTHLSEAYKKIG